MKRIACNMNWKDCLCETLLQSWAKCCCEVNHVCEQNLNVWWTACFMMWGWLWLVWRRWERFNNITATHKTPLQTQWRSKQSLVGDMEREGSTDLTWVKCEGPHAYSQSKWVEYRATISHTYPTHTTPTKHHMQALLLSHHITIHITHNLQYMTICEYECEA